MTRILIVGANGLLGNTLLRFFSISQSFVVAGTVRNKNYLKNLDIKKTLKYMIKLKLKKLITL